MENPEKQIEEAMQDTPQTAEAMVGKKSAVPELDGLVQTEGQADLPIDYRRVQHGHGPCSCCGPYSE